MTEGRIDMGMVSDKYEYMIVYSEPNSNKVNTWVLPDGSFQLNYKSMSERGCVIHNVFKRMTGKDLFNTMLGEQKPILMEIGGEENDV